MLDMFDMLGVLNMLDMFDSFYAMPAVVFYTTQIFSNVRWKWNLGDLLQIYIYMSDMVNSKVFVSQVLLRIKWTFEL